MMIYQEELRYCCFDEDFYVFLSIKVCKQVVL